ncbi:hypothetical protein [Treponema sp.]|uniref:hypothetical protein n=1 Tax=Treponema sp. TaxID=166 RepID=UPI00388E6F49
MKNKKKICAVLCALICFVGSSFAERFMKPTVRKQICGVWKYTIICDYNKDVMKKMLQLPAKTKELELFLDSIYEDNSISSSDISNGYKNGEFTSRIYGSGYNGKLPMPRGYFYVFKHPRSMLSIPSFGECEVPEKTKYVYLGSWEITIDPETFEYVSIKYVDEYEQASEWLNAKAKGEVELFNAEIREKEN